MKRDIQDGLKKYKWTQKQLSQLSSAMLQVVTSSPDEKAKAQMAKAIVSLFTLAAREEGTIGATKVVHSGTRSRTAGAPQSIGKKIGKAIEKGGMDVLKFKKQA